MLTEEMKLASAMRHAKRDKNNVLLLTCLASLAFACGASCVNKVSTPAFLTLAGASLTTLTVGCFKASRLERKEEYIRRKMAALKRERVNGRY